MTTYRPEFVAALELLAEVSGALVAQGCARPILVGGGAVELYVGSAIATGDFDVVTGRQDVFEQALLTRGFTRPAGVGHSFTGWIHPALRLGFEVVGSTLLDGKADGARVRLVDVDAANSLAVIAVEDLIADRMGQYASGTAPEMLGQAKALFALYPDCDRDYLYRRIREESANGYGVANIQD